MTGQIRKWTLLPIVSFLVFSASSCAIKSSRQETSPSAENQRTPAQADSSFSVFALAAGKEGLLSPDFVAKRKLSPSMYQVLNRYLAALKLENYSQKDIQEIADRVLQSSMQFLICKWEDWECLEREPINAAFLPSFRQDTVPGLGNRTLTGRKFNPQVFFSKQFLLPVEKRDMKTMMVLELSKKIRGGYAKKPWDSVSAAIYGIDDTGPGQSMESVFNALMEVRKTGTVVRAVTDAQRGKGGTVDYQYKDTLKLLQELGDHAHQECPVTDLIMHNKFLVFQQKNFAAVWTGTANTARTCMGDESNSNMTMYIEDPFLAKSYFDEFNEMYTLDACNFHRAKRPNTKRYFQYSDGTEVRVHFSPTDDAEHRAIIPAILAAQPGDEIRIGMFGSGGIEIIRALQWAESRGVKIKIVADLLTTVQVPNSWANKKNPDSLNNANPYPNGHPISIHPQDWAKQNHLKVATITRKGKPYILIIGSQNWSVRGNDDNDENNLTIRNMKGIPAGKEFNVYFDTMLWPNSNKRTFNVDASGPVDKAALDAEVENP